MLRYLLLLGIASSELSFAIECPGIPVLKCAATDIHEGRLEVPLDWFDRKDPRRIEFKYRIIGYQHTDRPYLILIGGGPGAPSIGNYFLQDTKDGSALTDAYRVVVFDQRGTGSSFPLDRSDSNLTPDLVARYFGPDQIAHDIGHLIRQLGRKDGEVALMGHSAGGLILAQYVAKSASGPRPKSAIFLSSITGTHTWQFMHHRYRRQIELNRRTMSDSMRADVLRLRAYIRTLNEDGEIVPEGALDGFFADLANDPERFEQTLTNLVEYTLNPNLRENFVMALTTKNLVVEQQLDRLGAALSPMWLDGYSDLEWAERNNSLAAEEEDWMLLERRMIKSIARSELAKRRLGANFEVLSRVAGRVHSRLASAHEVRQGLNEIPTLMLAADGDPYVDMDEARREFTDVSSKPFHHFVSIENGNHWSALRPEVTAFIVQKMKELEDELTRDREAERLCRAFLSPRDQTLEPWPFPKSVASKR